MVKSNEESKMANSFQIGVKWKLVENIKTKMWRNKILISGNIFCNGQRNYNTLEKQLGDEFFFQP